MNNHEKIQTKQKTVMIKMSFYSYNHKSQQQWAKGALYSPAMIQRINNQTTVGRIKSLYSLQPKKTKLKVVKLKRWSLILQYGDSADTQTRQPKSEAKQEA